ncbi:hypothetical protein LWI28_000770 [Acer negundo]|uniref:Uncharacterized protein n=1 Tax=Acer negundo TaxID=4023 RepID=A0AAD5J3A9_ACENE|nr:hypothetical protein LWI28_000770 [Acer negundo]
MLQQLLERQPNPNTPNDNVPAPTNRDGVEGVAIGRPGGGRLPRAVRHVQFEDFSDEDSDEDFAGYQRNPATPTSTQTLHTCRRSVSNLPLIVYRRRSAIFSRLSSTRRVAVDSLVRHLVDSLVCHRRRLTRSSSLTRSFIIAHNFNSQWDGVVCGKEGNESVATRVAVLILPKRGLKGIISRSLGRLDKLKLLDPSCNHFEGVLPAELSNLK